MKIKVIITELLLVSLTASLLCGCRKSYTAEISISESREESSDGEEENIVEKIDESSSADETSETKESEDEDTTSEKESFSGNSAVI